jgi:hypothetical protein
MASNFYSKFSGLNGSYPTCTGRLMADDFLILNDASWPAAEDRSSTAGPCGDGGPNRRTRPAAAARPSLLMDVRASVPTQTSAFARGRCWSGCRPERSRRCYPTSDRSEPENSHLVLSNRGCGHRKRSAASGHGGVSLAAADIRGDQVLGVRKQPCVCSQRFLY